MCQEFADKGLSIKAMVFSVIMYRYESWMIKKAEHGRTDAFKLWCWRRVLSHLNYKEIKPVNPKRNQSWIFFGRTVSEAEAPIIWPPNAKSQLTGKDSDAGKDWGQEEEGTTENEMIGWHQWLDGHEFEEIVKDREAWCAAVHGSQRVGHNWATEQQQQYMPGTCYKCGWHGDSQYPAPHHGLYYLILFWIML